MPKVRMLTTVAGPNGSHQAGDIVDVSKAEAAELTAITESDGGGTQGPYAELVVDAPVDAPVDGALTASMDTATTAAMPKAKARG